MDSSEIKCLIQKYPIIGGWIQSLPDELMFRCRLVNFQRGQMLFRRGEELQNVYIVCKGTVIISSSNINGNEMCVVFVQEGSSVGEMEAMMDISNIIYSARAFTNCVLLEIPVSVFKKWIRKDHGACRKLAMELAGKLYRSSASAVQYQNMSAEKRLKLFLTDNGVGRVSQTRDVLAEACGVSLRTVNRAVASLKGEGLIDVERGKIIISSDQMKKLTDSVLREV